ncbi:tripartite tricarboxylate transporter substrate binding protein, partial [Pseudomonas sp. SWRI111]
PYPPGGGTDVLFRLVAQYAEKHLGQTIVPTNMAGATSTVGSRFVKDAEPDGYTILGTHQVVATAEHTGVVDYGFSAFDPVVLMTST